MKNPKKKNIIVLFGLLVAVSSLYMCGGSEDIDDEVEFTVANGSEPQALDPQLISGTVESRISRALFEGLVQPNPKTSRAEPGVAESWSVDGSGKVYTMKIRKDAVWSDGVPITAETVRDSWFRILNPETASPYAWFPALFIKGAEAYNAGEGKKEDVAIRAIDAQTFQFETVGVLPYTVDALSHYAFSIVPLHTIEEYGGDWVLPENFVGNGPFVLSEWSPQEELVATKSDTYWNKDKVFIDTIVFIPTDNSNTMLNMYENNEVDWSTTVPAESFEVLRGRADYNVTPQLATYYYMFNYQKEPFTDMRIRKALALSIGREEIVARVLGEGQVAAYSMVPPMDGYTPIDKISEDEEEARRLLADAGYPNGEGFPETTIVYNTNDSHKKVAEYVQNRWKQVLNVDIKLENQEWKTFLSTRRNKEYDIARGGWLGDYLDPSTFLDLFISTSDLNDPGYVNPEYDRLIKEAPLRSATERLATLRKAETIMINEDYPVVPIYFYVHKHLIDTKKWEGWHTNLLDIHPYIGIKKVEKES